MSTAVPGRTAFIRSVASMPLITGMEMSTMATSGLSRSARATASAPSVASPTISMSGSCSRSWRVASRTKAWSSAIITRIFSIPGNPLPAL